MCGILGVTTKKQYNSKDLEAMASTLLRLSESRGKEASGLAVKRKESIDVLKLPISVSNFLRDPLYKEFSKKAFSDALSVIGHSRLATHGNEANSGNNQPVVKDNAVCVHNGIIANDENLWKLFPQFKRNYQVDTEVFLSLFQWFLSETGSMAEATRKTFETIEGSASVGVLFNNNYSLLLATNTGSLYVLDNETKDTFVFASERYILEQFVDKVKGIDLFKQEEIRQISPGRALVLDIRTLDKREFDFSEAKSVSEKMAIFPHPEIKFVNYADFQKSAAFPEASINKNNFKIAPEVRKVMHENWENIFYNYKIRRCTKCLLPETMTFIDFDENGVCNYCRNHKKIEVEGEEELERIVSQYRRSDGRPDCIVGFSGGRDSSYGLHYIKKILKMNPIAYTYDWGVLTDLGRRNEARICGKLGIEHIIISADIRRKRQNILINLKAWLRKPEMGVIPLLMAGDKQLMYYAEWLKKKTGIKLLIQCAGGGFENEFFKAGLAGVKITSDVPYQKLSLANKFKLTTYYASQYIRNPWYINRTLFDTIFAYYSTIFLSASALYLFNYIKWDEREILSTIINEYNWEREPDTYATWRIDDGTAAFYNYVFLTVLGLSELDALRSIQIREGQITREQAFELMKKEDKPRYDSIEWYAKIVGFNANEAIKRINEIPKFYLRKK